jgi:hypothetical protein
MGNMEDSDLRADTFRLTDGGSSFTLAHLPTGLRVTDPGPSEEPVAERWARLREQLAKLVAEQRS